MNPVLLDISRAVSRAPYLVPTGIDRVERAYIQHFMSSETPAWFLTRVFQGYALLDHKAMGYIYPRLCGEKPWGKPDLIARIMARKKHKIVNRAESDIRRIATGLCRRNGLTAMLTKHVPPGFTYLNVGHANRHQPLWNSMQISGKNIAMIHDVIPLDFPQYTRPDTAKRFETELYLTARNCDYLIYNSTDTKLRTEHWLEKQALTPPGLVALLGVDPLPKTVRSALTGPAKFVILGTVEPRKNHALLLDIWDGFGDNPDMPELHIVGRRGWQNDAVFNWLDQSPLMGKTVFEHNDLDDAGLATLLGQARALLFPTFAEGFGYPLIEALQMGIPVVASDLPCFREIAKDTPTYLSPDDHNGWRDVILGMQANSPEIQHELSPEIQGWEKHFCKLHDIL